MFKFEKLDVWQKAIEFADVIYSVTRSFPADERFGLTDQMRRGAVSVSSNIAEGSSRASDTDFARFVEIGTGSLFEVVSQATVAKRQQFLPESNFAAIYAMARGPRANAERLAPNTARQLAISDWLIAIR